MMTKENDVSNGEKFVALFNAHYEFWIWWARQELERQMASKVEP